MGDFTLYEIDPTIELLSGTETMLTFFRWAQIQGTWAYNKIDAV
jgi:hypothetical protein